MSPEQAASYVFAQAVAAMIECESMKAANAERAAKGEAQAYPERMFAELIVQYGIHHNGVLETYSGAAP